MLHLYRIDLICVMQIRGLYKSKQIFFLVAKFLIVAVALFFLFQQLNGVSYSEFQFLKSVFTSSDYAVLFVFLLLLLSSFNWILEIEKWRLLSNEIQALSFKDAFYQTLIGFTSSIITPAKAGDFVAKALYFPTNVRARVIWLNAVNNGTQLISTLFFGVIGIGTLLLLFPEFRNVFNNFNLGIIILGLTILTAVGLLLWKFSFKLTFQKFIKSTFNITRSVLLRVQILSLVKYLVFSFQFYLLLGYFSINLNYGLAMSLIATLYLFNSVIPTSALLDTVTKGGLAVFLFGIVGVAPLAILMVVFVMWIFNYCLPALIGAYFLLPFTSTKIMRRC